MDITVITDSRKLSAVRASRALAYAKEIVSSSDAFVRSAAYDLCATIGWLDLQRVAEHDQDSNVSLAFPNHAKEVVFVAHLVREYLLRGTWRLVSIEGKGRAYLQEDDTELVSGSHRFAIGRAGKNRFPGSLYLNTSVAPHRIEFRREREPFLHGVYRLEGDRLTVTVAPERPADFGGNVVVREVTSIDGTDAEVRIYRRIPPLGDSPTTR